jgi:hypothetical protein
LRSGFNLVAVELEITPPPTPEEREAIVAALEASAEEEPDAYRSAWRRAALEDEPDT